MMLLVGKVYSTGFLAIFSSPFSDSNVILSRNNETGFGEEGP
jgi:hypothetical protein